MSNTFATNSSANSAVSYLQRNSAWQSSSISKLSSGSRIVKASDDAASLAVGTKLKADVAALKQASTNADQAASMLQVADGALARISDTLVRMKSLATQANSTALSNTERGYLDLEYQKMSEQITYIADSTKFNDVAVVSGAMGTEFTKAGALNVDTVNVQADTGQTHNDSFTLASVTTAGASTMTMSDGTESQTVSVADLEADWTGTVEFDAFGITMEFEGAALDTALDSSADTITVDNGGATNQGAATFQVGVAETDTVTVNLKDATADNADINVDGTDITTMGNAATASQNIDGAIQTINERRAELGASMSRLEKINENLRTTTENLDAARSTLMDVDVAEEMTKFSTNQVMTQAATAMLAQANQLPQNLMRLLQ